MKMKQVYESNPALGDPMSIQGQLTENGHRLDKLRSELKKFQVLDAQQTSELWWDSDYGVSDPKFNFLTCLLLLKECYSQYMQTTVVALNKYTLSREERRLLYFNHLSKEFLEQMILHLKALI